MRVDVLQLELRQLVLLVLVEDEGPGEVDAVTRQSHSVRREHLARNTTQV